MLVIALAALLAPQTWLHKSISLVQILVPFQHAAEAGADAIGGALSIDAPPVPQTQYDTVLRSKQAAEHRLAALSMRIEELEHEVELLTATRLWNADGAKLGAKGRLIPARVLSQDMLPWRSSRLLTAGTVQGVEHGAAVISNYFTINRGTRDGLQSGSAILLGEALLGVVTQTGTHTSRVQLLSDPDTQMKVRIGRQGEDSFEVADGYYWLVGRGSGTMEIRDVKRQDVDEGRIAPGDLILSDPANDALPAALVIGEVDAVQLDPHKPLFAALAIKSAVNPADLERVYIYDPALNP